jgi:glc operon protein GlcG
MRTAALLALTIGAGLLLSATARAQPTQPERPAAPPPPEYGAPISNDQAKTAAAAAVAEAKKNNWHMVVSIVGPDGDLVYFEKMDGTQSASTALSQAKARTTALYRRPSKVFADQLAAGNVRIMTFPDQARPIASEGGVPIIVNGKLVGAIGVSGGSEQQDGLAASAGANALK